MNPEGSVYYSSSGVLWYFSWLAMAVIVFLALAGTDLKWEEWKRFWKTTSFWEITYLLMLATLFYLFAQAIWGWGKDQFFELIYSVTLAAFLDCLVRSYRNYKQQ